MLESLGDLVTRQSLYAGSSRAPPGGCRCRSARWPTHEVMRLGACRLVGERGLPPAPRARGDGARARRRTGLPRRRPRSARRGCPPRAGRGAAPCGRSPCTRCGRTTISAARNWPSADSRNVLPIAMTRTNASCVASATSSAGSRSPPGKRNAFTSCVTRSKLRTASCSHASSARADVAAVAVTAVERHELVVAEVSGRAGDESSVAMRRGQSDTSGGESSPRPPRT